MTRPLHCQPWPQHHQWLGLVVVVVLRCSNMFYIGGCDPAFLTSLHTIRSRLKNIRIATARTCTMINGEWFSMRSFTNSISYGKLPFLQLTIDLTKKPSSAIKVKYGEMFCSLIDCMVCKPVHTLYYSAMIRTEIVPVLASALACHYRDPQW